MAVSEGADSGEVDVDAVSNEDRVRCSPSSSQTTYLSCSFFPPSASWNKAMNPRPIRSPRIRSRSGRSSGLLP